MYFKHIRNCLVVHTNCLSQVSYVTIRIPLGSFLDILITFRIPGLRFANAFLFFRRAELSF